MGCFGSKESSASDLEGVFGDAGGGTIFAEPPASSGGGTIFAEPASSGASMFDGSFDDATSLNLPKETPMEKFYRYVALF